MKKHSPIILLLCFSWIVGMMFVSTGGISFEKSKIINDSAITNCFIGIDDLDYSQRYWKIWKKSMKCYTI